MPPVAIQAREFILGALGWAQERGDHVQPDRAKPFAGDPIFQYVSPSSSMPLTEGQACWYIAHGMKSGHNAHGDTTHHAMHKPDSHAQGCTALHG